jgi:signal transduction histidine kinase
MKQGTMTQPGHPASVFERPIPELPTILEEFAAVIAHELATPLTVVEGAVEALQRLDFDDAPEDRDRLLRMIGRNTRLASLLLRRLSLAREVEAGTVQLSLGPVDLVELVGETVDDLREVVLGEHAVALCHAATPMIDADETALREILFNLLSNAGKYSDRDAPIDVHIDVVGDDAQVVVRNHGSGVTPGDTETIFKKFMQGDPNSPGAGLGLFISRGLARAHGGDIAVQPAAERGSEFKLSLPMRARVTASEGRYESL